MKVLQQGNEGRLAHVAAVLRELGPRYAQDIVRNTQVIKDLYAPLLHARSMDGIAVQRGISYGKHERQVLDVFQPDGAKGADVVVFIHGGAFVRGARSGPEGLYDNVLTWFARQGFIGVNVEYRLAPEAAYPEGARDTAAAMEWVHRNIERFGGDPRRILLVGHSAGGTHVATYAADPVMADTPCRAKALVLVSGRLRADVSERNPNAAGVRSYFGEDVAAYAQRSPVTHAHRCRTPVLIAIAEFDNPLLDVYGLEFAHELAKAKGVAPRFVQCAGHNHMSIMGHFDAGEETLGPEILAFWAAARD